LGTDKRSARDVNANWELFCGAVSPPSSSSKRSASSTSSSGGEAHEDSSSSNNNNLGTSPPDLGFGKAAVMAMSNNGATPKFSKYSGAVEWRNCVYLWVNLASSKPGEFINEFEDGGRFMTWYGGSRMHEDSDVVQRLVASANASVSTLSKSKNTVILFVRLDGEPYCCFGPVRAHKFNLKRSPVAFTWELLLWEQLRSRENVKRILALCL
jgi:hypothetical protein